jgi:hypothetical protein
VSYLILTGRWYDVIVLNVHAPTEDKIDDVKHSFYEERERVFDGFPKFRMKILLGDFDELCFSGISNPKICVRKLVSLLCETADWTIRFMDFIDRLVFRTEHNFSETGSLALSNESILVGISPFFPTQGRKQISFSKRYILNARERRSAEGQ